MKAHVDMGAVRDESADVSRICTAVRQAVADSGLTQQDIGDRLGESQQTLSAWIKNREPKLDDLARIEETLGLARGYLVRAAGYVDELLTVEDALEADSTIPANLKPALLAAIDAARTI